MNKLKIHSINFSKYLSVGILVSLLNIIFSWFFIDLIRMKALLSSTIIGISIFLIKYFSYTKINLIHKKFKIFMIINISSVIAYIIFTALLIDIFLIPTLIAVPFVVGILFLLRYIAFHWTKILKDNTIKDTKDIIKKSKILETEKIRNFFKKPKNATILIFLFLILITLSTNYFGSTDVASFASPAKYFAGEHNAKIRSSHSYLLGFVNAPLVKLFQGFIGFKILNLIVLALLIYSIYYISKKNKKALFLMLLSPIIWYMAPWINSIQIASLLFLWNYYFIKKYEKSKKIKDLFYSGIFFGLASAFWHPVLFLGFFYIIFFFYNRKVSHLFYYGLSILIGLFPLLILDYFLFGFPFHSLIKNVVGTMSNSLGLGVYSDIREASKTFIRFLSLFLIIPIYFWSLYKFKNFKKDPKTILFLTTSLLFFTRNPQIRYLLIIIPIMILKLTQILNKKQIKRLLIISITISLIIIIPYEIQIKYPTTNGEEFTLFLTNFPNITMSEIDNNKIINQDLIKISQKYPDQKFLVGNNPDDYHVLADIYWGKNIDEFISIQDYNLFLQNSSILIEREFRSSPKKINDRREIWVKGGIGKPINDPTNYNTIEYAISLEEELNMEGFELIKKYEILSLFKKI